MVPHKHRITHLSFCFFFRYSLALSALLGLSIACGGGGSDPDALDDTAITNNDTAGGGGAPIEPFSPPIEDVILGQVVSTEGIPLSGALITAVWNGETHTATSNYDGYYYIDAVGTDVSIPMTFELPGYMAVRKSVQMFNKGAVTANAVLAKRAPSVVLDNTGRAETTRGAVTVVPGSIVDSQGDPANDVRVHISPLDIAGAEVQAAPGDFVATTAGGDFTRIETFAMAEFALTDSEGNPLSIADQQTAQIELLLPKDTAFVAGDTIPAWHYDEQAGQWVEQGTGTVAVSSADPTRLVFVADVPHFSWWNADKSYESSCVIGRLSYCDGSPAPGADILIQSDAYDGTSSGNTDANGDYCVAARRNSPVTVWAGSGYGANRLVQSATTMTPDVESTCESGPCATADIVLPCSPEQGDYDCDDIFFAGCQSCVRGTVVDDSGEPVRYALVKVVTGKTSATVSTDENGSYCVPAALDSVATITASYGASSGITSIIPTIGGACPNCSEADPITLSDTSSASDIDFGPCLNDVDGIELYPVLINGADPAILSLDSGWIDVYQTPAAGGEPGQWYIELHLLPKGTTTSLAGTPAARIQLRLPATPTGPTTYTTEDLGGSIRWSGQVDSALGELRGLADEVYRLAAGEDTSEPFGNATFTIDQAFSTVGDSVTGTFDVTFAADCAPGGGSVRIRGTFDTTVSNPSGGLPSNFDPESPEYKAWMCSIYGMYFLVFNWQNFWNGWVTALLDGSPIQGTDEDGPIGIATYHRADELLTMNYYGQDLTLFLQVEDLRSGENPVTAASLFLQAGSDCYYEVQSGTVDILDWSGEITDAWMNGTFDIQFVPIAGAGAACIPHTLTGTFGAPSCMSL